MRIGESISNTNIVFGPGTNGENTSGHEEAGPRARISLRKNAVFANATRRQQKVREPGAPVIFDERCG